MSTRTPSSWRLVASTQACPGGPHPSPVTTQSARRKASTTFSPSPVVTITAAAAPTTSATSSTTARYSTPACPRCSPIGRASGPRHGAGRADRHESAVAVPGLPLEVAEDHEVAPVARDHLPVAAPQRRVGPPPVLDQPRLAHRLDGPAVDRQGAAIVSRAYAREARRRQPAGTGHAGSPP